MTPQAREVDGGVAVQENEYTEFQDEKEPRRVLLARRKVFGQVGICTHVREMACVISTVCVSSTKETHVKRQRRSYVNQDIVAECTICTYPSLSFRSCLA